jgi:hypothetical protein
VGREFDKKTSGGRDPDSRQRSAPRGSGARKQTGYVGRATASDAGHSGYGVESIRPYLRAQLRLKELMASAFAPPVDPWGKKDRKSKTRK